MRATSINETELVAAARAGDRAALDDLVTAHLPFVYTIVRRALAGHPDADDVVQDVMLRAVRQLRMLRTPESFRPWLAAIAVRQVATHLRRRAEVASRTASIDDAAGVPDAAFEGLAALRVDLAGQRRQVVHAGRWLDPDDRVLLSLWWLEAAGQLNRAELAATLDVKLAHAGVRVQRMRQQLDVSRGVVAALDARPRCAGLEAIAAGWNGVPNPLWRKRFARHTRSCPTCGRAATGAVPAERLLAGLALLPVPVALSAALLKECALVPTAVAGGKAGLLAAHPMAVLAAHPVAAVVIAATLAAGVVGASVLHGDAAPRRASTGGRAGAAVAPGRLSLEAANAPGRYVAAGATFGYVGTATDGASRERATFEAVPGLADAACFSFRSRDGAFLRHIDWRLRLDQDNGTALFHGDATFCPRADPAAGAVALESSNYPGWFLRHRADELWVDRSDRTEEFRADSAFVVRPPLAR
ncbi:hypothetical protein Val02_37490 [Virgisporangium aliadipatigenens]|uniref:RNA polymerase sigma factor n=1 Tax=Virgisporangium aliadipatigenens TaxID=741659 RepID=A0A8J3YMK9_9ACTN|nr:sigma-70 family RNA polymerase sigma factor [Virgisporangium aliadipatigenens]GIJ46863.1 hypothetical protein Val02_37490 [Virgisporangium aliadipatigenens]